jgi:hypothetical protein
MALTLDGTLQTQLNGIERQPIARLITSSFAETVPFDGNDFGYSESSSINPNIISLSTGELIVISQKPSTSYGYRFLKTDTDRNQWSTSTFTAGNYTPKAIDMCEKPDGNIALLFSYNWSLTDAVRVTTISSDGVYSGTSYMVRMNAANYDYAYEPCIIYNSYISKYQVFIPWRDYDAGPAYYIYKYESSNLTSWTGPVDITPASLGNAAKYSRCEALLISDNDIALVFDYVTELDVSSTFETTNVYYMVSQDDGVTWAVPTAVTSYTGVGKAARRPSVVEKTTGAIYVTFHDRVTFIAVDEDTPGLIDDCGETDMEMIHMYDGKLYISGAYPGAGNKTLCGVWVIDPVDMSIEKNYTSTTTPGYSTMFKVNHHWPRQCTGGGKYLARFLGGGDGGTQTGAIMLVTYDGVTDQVTTYVVGEGGGAGDVPAYSLDENLAIPWPGGTGGWSVSKVMVDAANDRLYVYLYNGYHWTRSATWGYIDLTETADPGTGYYTWHSIWVKYYASTSAQYGLNNDDCLGFGVATFCPESGAAVFVKNASNGTVMVMDAASGVIQLFKNYTSDKKFPYKGLKNAHVYDGKIYGSFDYTSSYGQAAWRGLWIYDMVTTSKVTVRPGYATKDQYTFYDYDFNDIANGYIWIAGYDGALRYSVGSQSFEIWDETNIPGFDMGLPSPWCHGIYYDSVNEDVYVTSNGSYGQPWAGLRRFSVEGDYYQGQYLVGTKSGTSLGLGTQADFTYGLFERDISVVVDVDDYLWAVWDHVDRINDDREIWWDHDISEVNVTNDLVEAITMSWDIEIPGELRFSLANGHLYDQQNYLSSKSYLFRRGRKATVQLGENIADTPYWVDQGTFIVEEAKLRYIRGEFPVIEITARHISSLWQDARINLTEYYDEASPKLIVEGLLDDWTVLEDVEYDVPTFAYTHEIWHQWSDETLFEIIKDVLDHFGYAFFFDNVGVFAPARINFSKAIDHTYSDFEQISEYTPDSSFSNFINQIRVIGESHDFIEVVYEADLITNLSGTCGWWNETINKKIWYNEEKTKTCRNPYLDANISTNDFKFFIFKGGGGEKIKDIDDDELWVKVEIEGPNLIPVVVGLAAAALVLGIFAMPCDGWVTGYCGLAINSTNILISLFCYAVLATATYDIDVYAHPVGKEKQTIQWLAIDQDEMNIINQQPVIEEMEDPLCYSVSECQRVAEFELNILKYQRKRVRLTKLSHLQDEVLDMITVKHPFSGQTMQLLIASLTRTLSIKGQMLDTLEGWRIA